MLHRYFLKNGSQVARIHDYLSKTLLPGLERMHAGPKLFLEALVAPHMPQAVAIIGYESLEQLGQVESRLAGDAAYVKGLAAWEADAEQPIESYTSTLLAATDYSPQIAAPAEPSKTPRIFELRVYHSPSHRQLKLLHERFAGPEIKIFHRVGVHPILYSSTLIGPDKPNLTYVIPFENLAAREKAWNAFGADPEWLKVRQESIERGGQISSVIQINLYKAAAYSPIR
jgi:hypothetical protein